MSQHRIALPCDELPYKKTIRAQLYGGSTPTSRQVGWYTIIFLALAFLTKHLFPANAFGILLIWYCILMLTFSPSSGHGFL